MLFEDQYQTVDQVYEGTFRDKGSKFIAYLCPTKNENELKKYLAQYKAEHPKARHHCWAWRPDTNRNHFKLSDDGEPAGTAGRPILNTLLSHNLSKVAVIVVRYFGGTLLGVPGLINAYKMATQEAVLAANIITKTIKDVYELEFEYLQLNEVMRLIKEEQLHICEQNFDNLCLIKLEIDQSKVNLLSSKLDKIEKLSYKYLHTI